MNEKAIRVLEYPKIIEQLTECATCAPGKALCRALLPSTDLTQILSLQEETADALRRIYAKGGLSFSGLRDLRGDIRRLEIGSTLGIVELLATGRLLELAGKARKYEDPDTGKSRQQAAGSDAASGPYKSSGAVPDPSLMEDSLTELFGALDPVPSLGREIRRCILSEEEIADDASPELKRIRRQIALSQERIHTQLSEIVNGSARQYLQDALITQRDGRYCIPVKAEHRSQVAGMIHDQSSTGSTLFIEPMAIVKLNNDIRQLEADEKAEIQKILATLSEMAAASSDALISDTKIMIALDFIFARAQLAKKMNAVRPDFNEDGIIDLKRARHPLIDHKMVVPVDIRLGDGFDLLVISGPNTGGKTVSLKTVGLLTLMGQAGLHIPAAQHSALALFTEVFADIGDEQSIEQSLSTFSSHMTNIVSFWKQADEKSLVLFDELGAGTDPDEGAALAQWYYEEGHLYDNVFAWTKAEVAAKQRAGNPWADWWYDKEPSLAEVSEKPQTTTTPTQTTTTTPTADRVQYANWYDKVKAVAKKYPYATVYDFATGISWQIHIFSVGAHADYEPVTANDTAKLLKAFGGNTWNPRAVWVVFSDGSVYIGSTHSYAHDVQHVTDNNFAGHSCLHFPRTQAQVEAIGPYATKHQETIDAGWATTQKMK